MLRKEARHTLKVNKLQDSHTAATGEEEEEIERDAKGRRGKMERERCLRSLCTNGGRQESQSKICEKSMIQMFYTVSAFHYKHSETRLMKICAH